ncbi:MAG: hypothetical protein WCV90_02430 [Candidatus Woesearchaeota archaeon]
MENTKLFFAQDTTVINSVSSEPSFLDNLIHASFVRELTSPLLTDDMAQDSERVLREVAEGESKDLQDFVLDGAPFLVDGGHNNYTWKGVRGEYSLDLSKRERDFSGLMFSAGFIGHSSHVYLPTLPVKESKGVISKEYVPKIMLYTPQGLVEAKYDFSSNSFAPVTDGAILSPEAVVLKGIPAQISDYMRDEEIRDVEKFLQSKGRSIQQFDLSDEDDNNPLPPFREFIVESLRDSFGEWDLLPEKVPAYSNAIYQSLYWKNLVFRLSHYKGIVFNPEEDDHKVNLSYANCDEIFSAAARIKDLRRDGLPVNRETELNRFFLYKALEHKCVNSPECFVVGNIVGDTHRMHLPYVRVGMRKD